MFSRFDGTPAYDRETDGIAAAKSALCMESRSKNTVCGSCDVLKLLFSYKLLVVVFVVVYCCCRLGQVKFQRGRQCVWRG